MNITAKFKHDNISVNLVAGSNGGVWENPDGTGEIDNPIAVERGTTVS